jgi:hypothetical protein
VADVAANSTKEQQHEEEEEGDYEDEFDAPELESKEPELHFVISLDEGLEKTS